MARADAPPVAPLRAFLPFVIAAGLLVTIAASPARASAPVETGAAEAVAQLAIDESVGAGTVRTAGAADAATEQVARARGGTGNGKSPAGISWGKKKLIPVPPPGKRGRHP